MTMYRNHFDPSACPAREVVREAAALLGWSYDLLVAPRRRTPDLVMARFCAAIVIRRSLKVSLVMTARAIGRKDHTTILNALTHEERLRADPKWGKLIRSLEYFVSTWSVEMAA